MGSARGLAVFPDIDEKAIEAADRSEKDRRRQQRRAQSGIAGDGGDEDGGGKEEADRDFFGKTLRAMGDVDDEEPRDEKCAFYHVEAKGGGVEARQKGREKRGGQRDSYEEGNPVAVVKAMASFEFVFRGAAQRRECGRRRRGSIRVMAMAAGATGGRWMWLERAMNHVQSAATVGASSESRCQSATRLAVRVGRAS